MSNDKRRSYRYPVQDEFTRATIQVGRKELPATLINESAGGLLLSTAADPSIAPGKNVTVQIYSGAYLVEIVHTRPDAEGLQVGVRRFDGELQTQKRSTGAGRWKGGVQYGPPRNPLLFGAYAIIAVLTAMLVLGGYGGKVRKLFGSGEAHGPSLSALPSDFAGPIDWKSVQSLKGINSLTSTEIRNAIGLSNAQTRSLDVVFSDTSRRLQQIYKEHKDAPQTEWSHHSTEAIDEAVQRVFCTLTDQQIERWRKELIESVSAGPKSNHQAGSR